MKHIKQVFFSITLLLLLAAQAVAEEVVVYTAMDQIFSEPVFKSFQKQSGIKVKAVYDIEAVKTTGLVNRLLAEKKHPRCDVFWNNEIMRTIMLKRKDVLAPYASPSAVNIPAQFKDQDNYWTGFAARARVFVVNTNMLKSDQYPRSLQDLTNSKWKGKAAIAYPMFGTTSTHMASLFATWGAEQTETFLQSILRNKIMVVDGNSVVRDMVATGEIPWGLTDSDDVNVGVMGGKPIEPVLPDQTDGGTLLIPNTIALIKGAPHAEAAKKLIDFILSPEVEALLCSSESAQIPLRPGIPVPEGRFKQEDIVASKVDFEQTTDAMEFSVKTIQKLFAR